MEKSRAELRQALRDIQAVREELGAANRAKDHFIAALSHELRTPLTPVMLAVQTLSRRSDLPEPARDALEMIRRNVKIESHLIDDLLDLTRISSGKFEVVSEPVDLHAAVAGAIEICESEIRGKQQTLTVALEALCSRTEGDFDRLQQVVWNLLRNASKFTRNGGAIRVSSRSEGNRFFLAVSDDGVGIGRDVLPTMFDTFNRGGERIARELGGLGLGLAISKATIEAHGGVIRAASGGQDQGAVVTVELPLTASADPSPCKDDS
ncbi:MAG TPA: HAMP domain-containing sensor histidine kinase [Burkholderiaceae bacterium]|nr:HAMP domain-containing sensor histidine kinase [Burkholderiaceae bacterium]